MSKRNQILLGALALALSLALLCGCGKKDSRQPALPDPETGSISESAAQGASSSEEPAPIFITFEGTDLEGVGDVLQPLPERDARLGRAGGGV